MYQNLKLIAERLVLFIKPFVLRRCRCRRRRVFVRSLLFGRRMAKKYTKIYNALAEPLFYYLVSFSLVSL